MSESAQSPAPLSGPAKRRARTRSALLAAGRDLLAEGRANASVEEITKRAGVGFGSFFNHFPGGKEEFFDAAVFELIERYAVWLRPATAELDDPAEVFARSFRLTGRLALAQPSTLAPLSAHGLDLLFTERFLRAMALEDLQAGIDSGRFIDAPLVTHLVSVGSLLLGLVALVTRQDDPDLPTITEADVDASAACALRALGLSAEDADEVSARPLPELTGTIG